VVGAFHELGRNEEVTRNGFHGRKHPRRANAEITDLASNHIPARVFQLRSIAETAIPAHESKLA